MGNWLSQTPLLKMAVICKGHMLCINVTCKSTNLYNIINVTALRDVDFALYKY